MTDYPEIDYRDWRGTPITVGCHILYGVPWYSTVYIVEARVEKIFPRYTEIGKTDFPFHLFVTPIRRTDDETRYAPRKKWRRRIEKTERVTVIPALEPIVNKPTDARARMMGGA